MSNYNTNNLNIAHDQEITAHMPQSFQLMIRIQQEAEAEFKQIVEDIAAGITTLAAVKLARGLMV